MGWLGTRLLKKSPPEDIDLEVEEEEAPDAPSGPPLVLLVPDATAVSCFRCYTFYNAPDAAAFIESAVPSEARRGLHAFWASHQQPRTAGGEAMVLIRTSENSNLMYVVSFVDLASAQSFTRFEVTRGLSVALVTIYWANLIEIQETRDGLALTPATPPGVLAAEDAASPRPPAIRNAAPPLREAVEAPAGIAQPAHDPGGPAPLDEADEDPELHLLPEEPALVHEAPSLDVAAIPAFQPDKPESKAIAASDGATASEEPAAAPLNPVAAPDSPALSFPGDEEEDPPDIPAIYALEPTVETIAGDEELACEVWTLPAADAPTPATPDAGEDQARPDEDAAAADLTIEIEKILKNRRWQKRDDPFKGFGSPPGRF